MHALAIFVYGWLSGVVVLLLFVLYGVDTVTALMRYLCRAMEFVPFLADIAYGAQHAHASLRAHGASPGLRDAREHVLAAQGLEGIDGRTDDAASPLRLSSQCVLTWLQHNVTGTAMDCRLALCDHLLTVYERLPMQSGDDTRTAAEHVMGVVDVRHVTVDERRVTSTATATATAMTTTTRECGMTAAHTSAAFSGRVLVLRARDGHTLFASHDGEAAAATSPLPGAGTAVHTDNDHAHAARTTAATTTHHTAPPSSGASARVVGVAGAVAHTPHPSSSFASSSSSSSPRHHPHASPTPTTSSDDHHPRDGSDYTQRGRAGAMTSAKDAASGVRMRDVAASPFAPRAATTAASARRHDRADRVDTLVSDERACGSSVHARDGSECVTSAFAAPAMTYAAMTAPSVQALETDVHLWRSIVIKFATPRETERWRCVLLDVEEVNDWRAYVRRMSNTETANLFISRFFFQNMRCKGLQEAIRSAIRKKLQKMSVQKFPRMLGGQVLLDDFVIGKSIPWLSNVSEPAVSANGEMGFDMNLHYHGEDDGFSLYFRLALTFFGVRIPHVVLVLKLLELEATLHVSISPPPAKKFWLSGHKPPLLRVKVDQVAAASGKGVLHRILTALPDLSGMGTNLLKLYCLDEMVLPFMDDFPLPNINASPPHTPVEKVKTFDWHRAALMSGAPVATQRPRRRPQRSQHSSNSNNNNNEDADGSGDGGGVATAALATDAAVEAPATATTQPAAVASAMHTDNAAVVSATTAADACALRDDARVARGAVTTATATRASSMTSSPTATTLPRRGRSDKTDNDDNDDATMSTTTTTVSTSRQAEVWRRVVPPASTARTRRVHATVPPDAVRSHTHRDAHHTHDDDNNNNDHDRDHGYTVVVGGDVAGDDDSTRHARADATTTTTTVASDAATASCARRVRVGGVSLASSSPLAASAVGGVAHVCNNNNNSDDRRDGAGVWTGVTRTSVMPRVSPLPVFATADGVDGVAALVTTSTTTATTAQQQQQQQRLVQAQPLPPRGDGLLSSNEHGQAMSSLLLPPSPSRRAHEYVASSGTRAAQTTVMTTRPRERHDRAVAAARVATHWLDAELLAPEGGDARGGGGDSRNRGPYNNLAQRIDNNNYNNGRHDGVVAAAGGGGAAQGVTQRIGTTMAVVGGGSAAVVDHSRAADPTAMTQPSVLRDVEQAALTSTSDASLRRKRSERDVRRALKHKAADMHALVHARALPGGHM